VFPFLEAKKRVLDSDNESDTMTSARQHGVPSPAPEAPDGLDSLSVGTVASVSDSDGEPSRFHLAPQKSKRKPNARKYRIPFGANGKALSIEIQIRGPAKTQLLEQGPTGSWPWPYENSGQHFSFDKRVKLLKVTGAKRWFSSETHHTLDLTCSSGGFDEDDQTKDTILCLHVERQSLTLEDFDEFSSVVMSAPNLSREWSIVLSSLLKRVRKDYYDPSIARFRLWALRADGTDVGLSDTNDTTLSATTIGLPYFALGPLCGHGPSSTD
jgi:hypothetical protein